jgi:hypothetical protein
MNMVMRVFRISENTRVSKTLHFLSMLYGFAFSGPLSILRLASLFVSRSYLSGQDTLCDSLLSCGLISGKRKTSIDSSQVFVCFLVRGVV